MKRIICVFIMLLLVGNTNIYANALNECPEECFGLMNVYESDEALMARNVGCDVYDSEGERVSAETVFVSNVVLKEAAADKLTIKKYSYDEKLPDSAGYLVNENEYVLFMDIQTTDEENPYPELSQNVILELGRRGAPAGGRRPKIGKDYRLYGLNEETDEWNDLTFSITECDVYEVEFNVDSLGKYILIYNPAVYDVEFYMGEPVLVEDEEYVGYIKGELYYKVENLKDNDVVKFPPIPEKKGYVFTGWQEWRGSGITFLDSQPITARSVYEIYASWCPVDEYEPIELEISTEEPLIKGEEDGKKIVLTTNYGVFGDEEYWYNDWIIDYEAATDEDEKAEILSWHKEEWNVVGSDEVIVKSAERIDDKTVELTLMGNSSDVYDNSEIQIEFDGCFLLGEPYEVDGEIIDWDDTKIKLDEDGVRAEMYRSDNSIELKKQKRTSGGGGGSISYTVVFDEKGGSAVENQSVRKGDFAICPEVPKKEGFVFDGWYADEECTKEYDFNASISGGVTLYAKWIEEEKPETKENNQIILTIGEKSAEVFGEVKENDVAPILKDDRAFVPLRFVAESLGAEVIWSEDEPEKVVIRKDDVEIVLNIDSDKATKNGKEIILDSSAFLESDRTFVPVRFVFEALGADVEWDESENRVIVKKRNDRKMVRQSTLEKDQK